MLELEPSSYGKLVLGLNRGHMTFAFLSNKSQGFADDSMLCDFLTVMKVHAR